MNISRKPGSFVFPAGPAVVLFLAALAVAGLAWAQEKPSPTFKIEVTAEQANIRDTPDIGSPVVQQLPEGSVLEAEKKQGEWYMVRFTRDDGLVARGYIHESLVREIETVPSVPAEEIRVEPVKKIDEKPEPSSSSPRAPRTGPPPRFRRPAARPPAFPRPRRSASPFLPAPTLRPSATSIPAPRPGRLLRRRPRDSGHGRCRGTSPDLYRGRGDLLQPDARALRHARPGLFCRAPLEPHGVRRRRQSRRPPDPAAHPGPPGQGRAGLLPPASSTSRAASSIISSRPTISTASRNPSSGRNGRAKPRPAGSGPR